MDEPTRRPRHDRVDRDVAVAVGSTGRARVPGIQRDQRARVRLADRECRDGVRRHAKVAEPDDPGQERTMDAAQPDFHVSIRPDEVSRGRCGWVVDGQDRAVRVVCRDAACQVATRTREEPVLLGVEAGSLEHLGRLGRASSWPGPDVPRRSDRTASAAFCSARRIVSVNPRSITSAAMTSSVTMPPAKMTRTCPDSRLRGFLCGHPYCWRCIASVTTARIVIVLGMITKPAIGGVQLKQVYTVTVVG